MTAGRFAAIILAGGFSSRMRGFKPLLPLGDETITDRVISLFMSNGVEVFLVAGYRKDELLAGIKKTDINVVENPDYANGMFTSVKAGISHLRPEHQAFFIIPVDIPLVRAATIQKLMSVFEENPGKIIFPVSGGRRGHPPLLPASLSASVLKWDQEEGLKSFLLSQQANTLEIEVPDRFILFDIDTREDYQAMLEDLRRYEVPTKEECYVIIRDISRVAPRVVRHCLKVSELAAAMAEKLKEAGQDVDISLVRSSAILHDIAKGQPHHDVVGGEILKGLGFGKAGDIVSVHTDLSGGNRDITLEDKIVYLADKFVMEEKLVSIEERFRSADGLYGWNAEIEDKIRQRKERALKTKKELEILLGYPLEKTMGAAGRE